MHLENFQTKALPLKRLQSTSFRATSLGPKPSSWEESMKKIGGLGFAVLVVLLLTHLSAAQEKTPAHKAVPEKSPTSDNEPLILTAQIPLPGVHGRFDHFTFDPSEPARIFISALGNNSVEVI